MTLNNVFKIIILVIMCLEISCSTPPYVSPSHKNALNLSIDAEKSFSDGQNQKALQLYQQALMINFAIENKRSKGSGCTPLDSSRCFGLVVGQYPTLPSRRGSLARLWLDRQTPPEPPPRWHWDRYRKRQAIPPTCFTPNLFYITRVLRNQKP